MDLLTFGTVDTTQPPSSRQVGQGFVWRGAYNAGTSYSAYDTVSYNSAVYVALVGNVGVAPVDGATWSVMLAEVDYPIAIFMPGTYGSNAELAQINVPRSFTLPAGLTGSVAKLAAASTGTAVFKIKQNGTQIGNITFTASQNGVFSFISPVTFAVADILTIFAPTSVDATAAGFSLSLLGERVF